MLCHRLPQGGQALAEADEALVLSLLLRGPKRWVIQVLLAARGVVARCLDLRTRPRRDPDVLPRRRNDERLDPFECRRIADHAPARVAVAEGSLASGSRGHLVR